MILVPIEPHELPLLPEQILKKIFGDTLPDKKPQAAPAPPVQQVQPPAVPAPPAPPVLPPATPVVNGNTQTFLPRFHNSPMQQNTGAIDVMSGQNTDVTAPTAPAVPQFTAAPVSVAPVATAAPPAPAMPAPDFLHVQKLCMGLYNSDRRDWLMSTLSARGLSPQSLNQTEYLKVYEAIHAASGGQVA
jgi:hypothetical protein